MDWPDAPTPIPTVTRAQMEEIDRLMVDELGIELVQMMENAGANLARLARERFNPAHVLVAAGTGGNGGGGLVAARHLHNAGIPVTVVGAFVFGPVWGTVYSLIGATIGATAAFLVGRYAARGMVEGLIQKNEALKKIDEGVERQGWRMLMITRLVPVVPFNAQNYVYGLTRIRLLTYVVLSFVFMAPGTAAYNFAAGKLLRGEFEMTTLYYLAGAAVLFVLLSLLPGWLKKRYGDGDALAG